MLGRRSHARVSIASGAEGILSVTRDISVRVVTDDSFVAISRDAGVVGERVRVVIPDEERNVVAEVIESKPIVRDGAVRHQVLMRSISRESDSHCFEKSERWR